MYTIGVDIGGTQIRAGLVNEKGEIAYINKNMTLAHEGLDPVLERIMNTIDELLKKNGVKLSNVKGMGICAPGLLNPHSGKVISSPNLPEWEDIPLRDIIGGKYDIPVFLTNDGNAAALGEYIYGNGKDVENLLYITVSTGIGGGVIMDGRLLQGSDGNAAELGHMTVNPEGPECGCGNHGCVEAYSSGTGMVRRMLNLLEETNKPSKLRDVSKELNSGDHNYALTSKDIIEASQEGDELAEIIVNDARYYLGVALGNLINLFNPEMIVFGGGVSQAGDSFLNPAIEEAKTRSMKGISDNIKFTKTKHGDEIGVLGAAALVDHYLKEEQQN